MVVAARFDRKVKPSKSRFTIRLASGTLLAACSALPLPAHGVCVLPAALAARLRVHPGGQSYSDAGTWFGKQRQYSCAVDAFQSALKSEPRSPRLLYLLGLTLYSSGHAGEAVPALEKSIQFDPNSLQARLILGSALNDLQRTAEAQIQWNAALQLDPKSPVAMDGLSKSLIADGDYSGVIRLLSPVGRNEELTLDLALAYAKAGALEEAAQTLTPALAAAPSSLRLTSAMITVLVKQQRYQEATLLAKESVRLHPDDLDAQRHYLSLLVLNGDAALGRPLGRKLLAAAPHDFDVLYLNGILERIAGEYPAARSHLEQAVAINPNHASSRFHLGMALDKLKDETGAKEQLERAIALGAPEPEVHFQLATVLRALGDTQQAQQQLKLYQTESKANASVRMAAAKDAQADGELDKGNLPGAVALYRDAAQASPLDAMIAYKLAMALDRSGDVAGERSALQQVVKIDPGFALAHNQLGYLDSSSGDPAGAEQHYRLAVQAAPDFAEGWISLAATLAMESRIPEAEEAVANALRLDPHNAKALELSKDLSGAHTQR